VGQSNKLENWQNTDKNSAECHSFYFSYDNSHYVVWDFMLKIWAFTVLKRFVGWYNVSLFFGQI
jgi:hypothetical protein